MIDRRDARPEYLPGREYHHLVGDTLGYLYWGRIYNEKTPRRFSDGAYIRTSLVKKEEIIDGQRYLHTINSTYRIIE